MHRIGVFCGSHSGLSPVYADAARALGRELARRDLELVYGGGSVGLMGTLADTVLAAGGRVTGIIPRFLLDREVGHRGLTTLEVVGSMHARKARLAELVDAFVALPGGLGTVEEICEIVTWAQLGLHAKPCALLDVAGYFAPLVAFLDSTVTAGFVRPEHRALLLVAHDPAALLDRLAMGTAAITPKWLERT